MPDQEPEFPLLFTKELEKRIPGIKITKSMFWGHYNINKSKKVPLCLTFYDEYLVLSTSILIDDTAVTMDEHTWEERFEYNNPNEFDIDKIIKLIRLFTDGLG